MHGTTKLKLCISLSLCKNHIFVVTTTNNEKGSPLQCAMLLVPVHHYRHIRYLFAERNAIVNPVFPAPRHA